MGKSRRYAPVVRVCIISGAMFSLRQKVLVGLAVLVMAFVALYPYLESMDMCGSMACPYAMQSSHSDSGGTMAACAGYGIAASWAALLTLTALRRFRLVRADSRPDQLYLSPESPPPRFL